MRVKIRRQRSMLRQRRIQHSGLRRLGITDSRLRQAGPQRTLHLVMRWLREVLAETGHIATERA